MSTDAQIIWYLAALIGFLIAAFSPLRADRSVWGVHTGWLGLACMAVVLLWTAIKAS
jgi:hypothetical protein